MSPAAAATGPQGLVRSPDYAAARAATAHEVLAQHRIIFDNAIVGICYTQDRVILRCNQRFEQMFDYSEGELEGQGIVLLYPSYEDYEVIGRRGYGHLVDHETYSDERLMRRKGGELFWCQVSGKTLDLSHPSQGAVWIFQDVSERKRAEEALLRAHDRLEQRVQERTADLRRAYEALREEMRIREKTEEALVASNEKYRALFDMFPVGISITDEQGQVIEINKTLGRMSSLSSLAQLTRDLELTRPSAALIKADGSTMQQNELPSARAIAEQREIADAELGVRYANSKVRWFSVTAAPIPVKGYGAVVAYTEITQRKRAEEKQRLHQAELARVSRLNTMGEMAGALAHELGQPLSATLNYLHGCRLRLNAGEFAPELFDSALSQAIHHAEQAGSIVRHVRSFVRRHEPESTPTDLGALIEEMLGLLNFERRQHRVEVRLRLAAEPTIVMIDPLEIQQVMVNLVKNAIEAMADKPDGERCLEIESRIRDGGAVEVSVSDRGPGVARKNLTQIFDAFYTTKRNGVGLGLAVCRSIVESHGSRLTVGRNVLGGATFRFELPLAKP